MLVRVNEHKCEIVKTPVNEKEINITKVNFEFADVITDDYVKEAYFTLNGETYKQIIVNNECDIPYEVLTQKGQIEIGVVAYLVENEEEIKRYNPSPAYFETWIGSLKDAENSEPITPSEMEQYEQALQDGLTEVNDKLDDIDQALTDVNTAITETNNLNLDVSKSGKTATVTLTKKDNTTKVVTLSDGTSLMFNWDGTKLGIKTDDDESYTYVDLQGVQGEQGPMGAPFTIKKTYSSVAEMNADFNNMNVGDYVMITSSVEVEDNAKLYCKGTEAWIFITDFSGATGIQGPTGATPNIQIGTVTTGETSSVTRSGTNENPVLNFVLEKGETGQTGQTGATGNGIASIEKTSTSGLVDLYTITYTNGNTDTFTVTNGEVALDQLNYYRMIENALPKVTGTGTNITLNNTAETPLKLKLEPSELSQDNTPTPNNPQNVHVITGNNTIIITNKNFFNKNTITNKKYVKSSDGTIATTNGTFASDYIVVMPNTTYYWNDSTNRTNQGAYYDKNQNYISGISNRSFTTPNNAKYVRLTGDSLLVETLQLEKGTETTYMPYQEQNLTMTLGDLEYCKINDYKDEFYKATASDTSLQEGKWYLKKNTSKIDSYNGETITTDYMSTTGGLDTGATVYYGITTPAYILLNNTLQTELDNIYEWAKAYQNQTNICQINEDLPFIINSKAIRDMSNIFDLINGE